MFAICYYLLLCIANILILPILLFFAIFKKKYRQSIPARFFLYKNYSLGNPDIWLHACSLGEVNALQVLFSDEISNKRILVTTITNTGFQRAKELFSSYENIAIRFLPFEIFIPFVIPKSVKKLVVLEAELWFMLFFCAKKMGAETTLLNARISSKSFPKYKKYKFFYMQLFKYVDWIVCQQDSDKERFLALGAENIEVLGNIKSLLKPRTSENLALFQASKNDFLAKCPNATLIVAASTHRGEEELILQSYLKHFANSKTHRLIIAPRHPERFSEVWDLLKSHNAVRYSQNGLDLSSEIILLDVLGELINAYAIADCVILGGSFVKVGGHNPLECAYFGVKIITGEFIFNQLALFALVEHYAIVSELSEILGNLEQLKRSKIKDSALHLMQNKITEILTK